MCDTKCDGDFQPPSVKAECQAKVHADAKLNVQCTPPHVAFNYKLKASLTAAAQLEARVKFEAALKTLIDVRLPALKAALKRSELVASAGADLSASAKGALSTAITAAQANAGVHAKVGLGCAALQLPNVGKVVDGSTANLQRSVDAAGKINAALNI